MPLPSSSQVNTRGKNVKNTHQTTLDGQNVNTESSRPGTPVTGPTQAAGRRAPPKLTAQEIIVLSNEVHDTSTRKKYLERMALSISGKPYTTNALTEILLHITQISGVPLTAITAISAVAFILEGKATDETAETIAKLVVALISPHVAKLQEIKENINKTAVELNTNAVVHDSQLAKVQTSVEKLTTQVADSASLKPSYATALQSGVQQHPTETGPQNQHIQQMAREAMKERQVLIDFLPNSPLAAGKSSHAQLVERIRKALATLPKEDDNELIMKAVSQFKQGGMIIEFTSKEAANYIRNNNAIKEQFLKDLDPDTSLKERTYPIVIPFMPIAFDPTSQLNREALEDENGWKKDSILTAHWIKPVEKRTSTQQVAHILITLTDSMAANTAIRDGITFGQLKLWLKKNRREPMRCAKCQHYGHIAHECISHTNTCTN